MTPTATLRRQHAELLALMRAVTPLLRRGTLVGELDVVRTMLAQLSGLLSVHLAMEDTSFYPGLVVHENADLAALAARYADEMGGLQQAFLEYRARWSATNDVREKPDEFTSETLQVFALLSRRIKREDEDLYRAVERLAS